MATINKQDVPIDLIIDGMIALSINPHLPHVRNGCGALMCKTAGKQCIDCSSNRRCNGEQCRKSMQPTRTTSGTTYPMIPETVYDL